MFSFTFCIRFTEISLSIIPQIMAKNFIFTTRTGLQLFPKASFLTGLSGCARIYFPFPRAHRGTYAAAKSYKFECISWRAAVGKLGVCLREMKCSEQVTSLIWASKTCFFVSLCWTGRRSMAEEIVHHQRLLLQKKSLFFARLDSFPPHLLLLLSAKKSGLDFSPPPPPAWQGRTSIIIHHPQLYTRGNKVGRRG